MIAVSVGDDAQWRALVDVMDRPAWCADPDLATVDGRRQRADDIDARLAQWFGRQDLDSTVELLAGAGIPAAPVVSPSLVTDNPQLLARGFFEALHHPSTGVGLYPCPPFALLTGQDKWLLRPRRSWASTMKRSCAIGAG